MCQKAVIPLMWSNTFVLGLLKHFGSAQADGCRNEYIFFKIFRQELLSVLFLAVSSHTLVTCCEDVVVNQVLLVKSCSDVDSRKPEENACRLKLVVLLDV